MKRVSRNLGKKFSEGRKQRHREGIARRIAAGEKFGSPPDPRTRIEWRRCQLPSCGVEFRFRVRPATDPKAGRYCRQQHAVKHVSILRMKVPDNYDLLFDLYVTRNMSTPEIGELFDTTHGAVRHRLKYLGIVARKVGHSRHIVCNVEGCGVPALKLKHATNGSMFGTKCAVHRKAHRDAGRWEYRLRKTGNRPAVVLRALEAGAKTSREISERTGLTIKIVCTTLGHLRKRGEVESFGSIRINRALQLLWRPSTAREQAA